MKKQKTKFVLAEATLEEVNKQLKINMFVIVLVALILLLNIANFMQSYSLFYGLLVVVMIFFLFIIIKSRQILEMRKKALTRVE
ncbi:MULTISPECIES: hypothetical protein [Psychrobacter]|uniref:Uncharacterized protein n=1 Tax=Psychrobacter alimentarius TaxID=261164 RepID=A0ABM6A0F1_9GAMM|nr:MULTISPECIES: hypothetical protein [Psychrobacter]AMT97805.1 hypothetical protein A3K91_2225 [Psychrobacter alimentarius]QCB29915.1 hypothetical protein E5677_02295 [Psychrobacter sp. PAMC27889]